MDWYKIEITAVREKSEEISDFLIDKGCNGLEIIDPDEIEAFIDELDTLEYANESLLPKDIKGVLIIGYLIDKKAAFEIKETYDDCTISIIRDSDWEENWKKYYDEFTIGENILICPSWKKSSDISKRKKIFIDPGMAFGSGEHETTFMCAQILDSCEVCNKRVLDVGTGSGILSIIAAKLGGAYIKAIDIDEVAIRAAKENSIRNMVDIDAEKIEIKDLDMQKYDIIVANIVSKVLIDIKDEIRKRVVDKGMIILSGIIKDRYDEIFREYTDAGFKLREEHRKKEWVALIFDA